MFCKNCGNPISEGAAFCKECGAAIGSAAAPVVEEVVETAPVVEEVVETAPVEEAYAPQEVFVAEETAPKKAKSKKPIIIAIIAVVVAAILGVVGYFVWNTFFNKLDVTEYIEVSDAEGFSGYASINVKVDYVKIARELELGGTSDMKKLEELEEEGIFYWGMSKDEIEEIETRYDLNLKKFKKLYKAIEVEIEDNGKLKNGDQVVVKIKVKDDDDFKKKLVGGEETVKVKGLDEAEVIDLFEGTNIIFTGDNGKGKITVQENFLDSWRYNIEYTAEGENFSNGDTVVVTATFNEDYYERYYNQLIEDGKYLPKTQTTEVTVSGLIVYAAAKDITAEVKEQAFEFAKSKFYNRDRYTFSYGEFYIATNNAEEQSYYSVKNAILFEIKYTYTSFGYSYDYSYIYRITNVKLDDEGKVVFGDSNGYGTVFNTEDVNVEEKLADYYPDFTIEKVK